MNPVVLVGFRMASVLETGTNPSPIPVMVLKNSNGTIGSGCRVLSVISVSFSTFAASSLIKVSLGKLTLNTLESVVVVVIGTSVAVTVVAVVEVASVVVVVASVVVIVVASVVAVV